MSSSPDCGSDYTTFGGRSTRSAMGQGVAQGAVGMLGLGGFWNPVSETAITNLQNTFQTVQQQWNAVINKDQGRLSEYQGQIAQNQLNLLQAFDAFGQEMLQEAISKNSLYIAFIFVALIIVIIYLMVL